MHLLGTVQVLSLWNQFGHYHLHFLSHTDFLLLVIAVTAENMDLQRYAIIEKNVA